MKNLFVNLSAALTLMLAVSCSCNCNKCQNGEAAANDSTACCAKACNDSTKACCGDSAKACCAEAEKACCLSDSAKEAAAAALEAEMTEEQLDSLDNAALSSAFSSVTGGSSVQLTPAQQAKLKDMITSARAEAAEIKKMAREERRAARQALQAKCAAFLNELLDEEQLKAIGAK